MILGSMELLTLIRDHQLVEGLSSRELENPEGAGIDLRIGELHEIFGTAFLGIEERQTPKSRIVAEYDKSRRVSHTIKPGDFYLVKTIERLNVPSYLTVNLNPRTTTFRSGLIIRTGNVAPGYRGELVFGLKNVGPCEVMIEMGARIVHAQFYLVEGESNLYRGQWQDGRVTTGGLERQV